MKKMHDDVINNK